MSIGDRVTRTDGRIFVYNLAVALSGWALIDFLELAGRVGPLIAASGAALVWTIYFRQAMLEGIRGDENGD